MSHPSHVLDPSRFVLVLHKSPPGLNALAGDRILVRLGHDNPILLIRTMPTDYRPLLTALERGEAGALDLGRDTTDPMVLLRSVLGITSPKAKRGHAVPQEYGDLRLIQGGAR